MAGKSPYFPLTPKGNTKLQPTRALQIEIDGSTAGDMEPVYAKNKFQTTRNAQGFVRKSQQSNSATSTPMNSTPKGVRANQQIVLMDIQKPRTGNGTPKATSKPGTQRAVFSSLTQKKFVQPPRDLGSPRNSPLTSSPKPSTSIMKSQSASSLKPLTGLVTQVQSSLISPPGKRSTLTQDQIRERSERVYREHLFQTFQALKFVRTLGQPDAASIRAKRVFLEKRKGYLNKKTLIFDLDETLVHCVEDITHGSPDVILPITFLSGEVVNAGINVRPYAREALMEANRLFEVVVFTASHQCYADVVLNYLDPSNTLIHHRLYRDNCLPVEGLFLKDLRIFANRRPQDLIIVDNAAYSFAFQLDNGIPIISWHDDPYDRELLNLMDYMKVLSDCEDVRSVNRETFHLNTFYEDYMQEFMGNEEKRGKGMTRRM